MATMTIRNIDDRLKAGLRVRAAMHGRSMEDEARDILRTALSAEPRVGEAWWMPFGPGLNRWAGSNWSFRLVR